MRLFEASRATATSLSFSLSRLLVAARRPDREMANRAGVPTADRRTAGKSISIRPLLSLSLELPRGQFARPAAGLGGFAQAAESSSPVCVHFSRRRRRKSIALAAILQLKLTSSHPRATTIGLRSGPLKVRHLQQQQQQEGVWLTSWSASGNRLASDRRLPPPSPLKEVLISSRLIRRASAHLPPVIFWPLNGRAEAASARRRLATICRPRARACAVRARQPIARSRTARRSIVTLRPDERLASLSASLSVCWAAN